MTRKEITVSQLQLETDHDISHFVFPHLLFFSYLPSETFSPPSFLFSGLFLSSLSPFPPSNLPPAPVLHHPSHLSVHLLSSPWLQHSQCFTLSWRLGSRLKPYLTRWRWHSPLIIVKGCSTEEREMDYIHIVLYCFNTPSDLRLLNLKFKKNVQKI